MAEKKNNDSSDGSLPEVIGERIRNHRKTNGLSQGQLSALSGVSVSMISKIEKGLSLPPISTYANIARELGLSLSQMVAEKTPRKNISVVKVRDRAPMSNGVYEAYNLARHFAGKKFVPFLMHFPAEKKEYHKPFIHSHTQEMLFLLEGSIEFSYEGRTIRLEEGDCVCFNGDVPHSSRSISDKDVRILAIQVSE